MANIWDTAVEMEKEGAAYYRELAGDSNISALKGVFNFLAQQENTHAALFESFKNDIEGKAPDSNEAIAFAKKAFAEIAVSFDTDGPLLEAKEAYRKALAAEQNAVKYYTELKEQATDDAQKTALDVIISEEISHASLMEGLVEFTRQPKTWLENAEFNHLEDY